LHNKSIGCGASGAYALGPDERRKEHYTEMHGQKNVKKVIILTTNPK
jgi:hypothetical protein